MRTVVLGHADRATVLFEYDADEETNITIVLGDVVVVKDSSDPDWWEGHVEVRSALSSTSCCFQLFCVSFDERRCFTTTGSGRKVRATLNRTALCTGQA